MISDETYAGLVYDNGTVPDTRSIFAGGEIVRLLSFSKLFGIPGERVGCAIANPALVERIVDAHFAFAMSAPATAQTLALSALTSAPDRHIRELATVLTRRRALAVELLATSPWLRFAPPQGGCFLWIEVVDCRLDARSLAQRCRQEGGVNVIHGQAFGMTSPTYLRASLAVPEDELRVGLQRLKDVTLESTRSAT